jgi:selT/selW/selH-like putative selenoprotein
VTGPPHSFDVYVNGELVFSKAEQGRFPEADEIVAAVEAVLAGDSPDGR